MGFETLYSAPLMKEQLIRGLMPLFGWECHSDKKSLISTALIGMGAALLPDTQER